MLPSLLARDIQKGLEQFLLTGFEASDAFMHGVVQRFVDQPAGWLKGPYLQVGLPLLRGWPVKSFSIILKLKTLATATKRPHGSACLLCIVRPAH